MGYDDLSQVDAEAMSNIPNWIIEGIDPRLGHSNDITEHLSDLANYRSFIKK